MASRSPTPTTGGSTPSGRAQPDHQSGHQLFDNCRSIVTPGSRHAAPGRYTAASRLTGRAPGSYPGTDWVRDPGRAPRRRSSAGWSAGPSSRRLRVRVPSVARMSTWPNGQGTGLRIRRMQVRLLPSTPSRRSSAEQSAALRRRRSHVRIVPARPTRQALVAQEESTSPVRTRSWVRLPPRAPWKRSGRMRSLSRKQVGVASPWGASPTASARRRDGPEVKTPGPQPGGRGSIPRRGTHTATIGDDIDAR